MKTIVHTFQPVLLTVWSVVAAGGAGLAAQGLVMFLLDWTVLDRARAYASALVHFPS